MKIKEALRSNMKGAGKKSEETFYVHEMLAGFRVDDVPMYCK